MAESRYGGAYVPKEAEDVDPKLEIDKKCESRCTSALAAYDACAVRIEEKVRSSGNRVPFRHATPPLSPQPSPLFLSFPSFTTLHHDSTLHLPSTLSTLPPPYIIINAFLHPTRPARGGSFLAPTPVYALPRPTSLPHPTPSTLQGRGECSGYYMDFLKCVDTCAAKSLFSKVM